MQSPDDRARHNKPPCADIVRVEQCGKLLADPISDPDRGLAGAGVDVNADCDAGTCAQCSMLNAECAMLKRRMPNAQRQCRIVNAQSTPSIVTLNIPSSILH